MDKPTTDPAFARLRIQEGIDPYLRYVEGAPPTTTVTTRDDVGLTAQDGVPVYEVGISEATAERFDIALGETVPLVGDPGDPLTGRGSREALAFATVTGIYEVLQPDADFWLDDPTLIHPVIRALSADVQLLDAAFLLADGTARGAGAADGRRRPRAPLHVALVPRHEPAQRPEPRPHDHRLPPAAGPVPVRERVGELGHGPAHGHAADPRAAPGALGGRRVRRRGRSRSARRSWPSAPSRSSPSSPRAGGGSTMALARSRGASGAQVIVPVVVEGLLIGLPAAVAAAVAAVLLVPAGRIDVTIAAAASVVAVAVVVIVATILGVARGQGAERAGGTRIVTDTGPRRLMFEGLIVAAAIGAAILLRQRGVAAVRDANGGAGFDPLVAAVPALVGLAAGILVVRLYRIPLAVVALGRRPRARPVPMLAARRAREGGAGSAVLLVLLATATVGAFAMTALDHLERGAEVAAWQQVGASYRLQQPSGALPTGFDPATLPAVEADSRRLPGEHPGVDHRPAGADRDARGGGARGGPRRDARARPASRPASRRRRRARSRRSSRRSLADSPRGVGLGETFTLSIEGYNAHLQGRGGPRLVPGRAAQGPLHPRLPRGVPRAGAARPGRARLLAGPRAGALPRPRSARPSRTRSRRSSSRARPRPRPRSAPSRSRTPCGR